MDRKVALLKVSKQEEEIGDPNGMVSVQTERNEWLVGTDCNPLKDVRGGAFG